MITIISDCISKFPSERAIYIHNESSRSNLIDTFSNVVERNQTDWQITGKYRKLHSTEEIIASRHKII
jgi:hypothetical protein